MVIRANSVPPVVLTIAGFDPSSGAGVTADLQTIAAHDCFGVSCVTALTVQNTSGVFGLELVKPALVVQTLSRLAEDFQFAAVKIGLLGSEEVACAVAKFLQDHRFPRIVLDPVLKSSSGSVLLDGGGVKAMKEQLLPLAFVLTPNWQEAETLTGMQLHEMNQRKAVAQRLREMGARNVVLTGGHLPEPSDFLLTESGDEHILTADKIDSTSTHGTGCAFSTSIACNLALGKSLTDAVVDAKEYVRQAMLFAFKAGKGKGPLNHLFARR